MPALDLGYLGYVQAHHASGGHAMEKNRTRISKVTCSFMSANLFGLDMGPVM